MVTSAARLKAAGRSHNRRVRHGRTEPRIFTPPLRELTAETSLGFAAVDFAKNVCGIDLFPWQRWLLVHMLELAGDLTVSTLASRDSMDPLFRFRKVVVLVARQNGKSTVSQVLALFFLYILGVDLVLGTAQDLDTAEEVWDGCNDIIDETPELSELTDRPIRVNGKKTIRLKSGERYKVKAANRKAGRGLSGDLVMLDELREHTSWDAWAAITKTTQARPAALIAAFSNAGDMSSVVLKTLRAMAHEALGDPDGINAAEQARQTPTVDEIAGMVDLDDDHDDEDSGVDGLELTPEDFEEDPDTLGIFEWSAAPGCSVLDRGGWDQSNPSEGYCIAESTIAGDAHTEGMRADTEWVFRCLDVATPILTSRGWSTMADVAVGDQVKGVDGSWVNVTGISPVYEDRDCYRLVLNDGRSIVCDAGHLWSVKDRRRTCGYETVRTSDLIERGVTYHNPSMDFDVRNFQLPPVQALDGPDVGLPVDPYLMGLWLGDGSEHAALIFIEDRDVEHVESMMRQHGAEIISKVKDSDHCYRISFQAGGRGGFTTALRSMGVLNNKHLPGVYMTASREQRLWLLRGFMDSDGTVAKRSGRCSFTNTNHELVKAVRTIVRSLGWKTSEIKGKVYGKPNWLPRYDVSFTTRPDEPLPVSLPRKAELIRPCRSYRDVRPATIASIEPVASVPVRCIKVDASDSLFLAGDLIPTHNTEVLCQWPDGGLHGPFPSGSWEKGVNRVVEEPDGSRHLADEDRLTGRVVAAVDMSLDRSHTWIARAGRRADGVLQAELWHAETGTGWVQRWLAEHASEIDVWTGQLRGAQISDLVGRLSTDREVEVPYVRLDVWQCFGVAHDLVRDGLVRHNPQPPLDLAAATAEIHYSGDQGVIDQKRSPGDASPLMAWVEAVWLAQQPVKRAKPVPVAQVVKPDSVAPAGRSRLSGLRGRVRGASILNQQF